jgi:hypothetical protein
MVVPAGIELNTFTTFAPRPPPYERRMESPPLAPYRVTVRVEISCGAVNCWGPPVYRNTLEADVTSVAAAFSQMHWPS